MVEEIKLFLILFLLIFKLKIYLIDFSLIVFIISLIVLLKRKFKYNIEKRLMIIFFSILLIYIYSLIITLLSPHNNIFYILKYSRVLVTLFSNYIIIKYLASKYNFKELLVGIGNVLAFHLLIMWLQVFLPGFKNMLQKYLFSAGRDNWYRVTGLMNGTSSAGIFLGISAVIFMYIYLVYKKKKFLYFYILSLPMFPLSAITGLILALVGGFLLNINKLVKFKFIFKLVLFILIFIMIFYSTYKLDIEIFDRYGITKAQDRIMLLFYDDVNVQHGNIINSVNMLLKSYSFPDMNLNFIFGNIQPSKSKFATTYSDAGIIANFHAYGLFGLSVLLISLGLHAYLSKNRLIYILTLVYLIAFFKNDLLYGRIVYDLFINVVIIIIIFQEKYLKNDFVNQTYLGSVNVE